MVITVMIYPPSSLFLPDHEKIFFSSFHIGLAIFLDTRKQMQNYYTLKNLQACFLPADLSDIIMIRGSTGS